MCKLRLDSHGNPALSTLTWHTYTVSWLPKTPAHLLVWHRAHFPSSLAIPVRHHCQLIAGCHGQLTALLPAPLWAQLALYRNLCYRWICSCTTQSCTGKILICLKLGQPYHDLSRNRSEKLSLPWRKDREEKGVCQWVSSPTLRCVSAL